MYNLIVTEIFIMSTGRGEHSQIVHGLFKNGSCIVGNIGVLFSTLIVRMRTKGGIALGVRQLFRTAA